MHQCYDKIKTVIGIDNGVTGTMAIFKNGSLFSFIESFSKSWRKPTVSKRNAYMTRIDVLKLTDWIKNSIDFETHDVIAVIERVMTDQKRFNATISSHHAQEAIMISLESLNIPYMTIDSKKWQSIYLNGVSGSEQLKRASMELGLDKYPDFKDVILKHKDADAIFIAKYVVDDTDRFISDAKRPKIEVKKHKKRIFNTNLEGNQ